MINLEEAKYRILTGGEINADEAYELDSLVDTHLNDLLEAATEITRKFSSQKFDSCSIINARSGKCSENCKWCAQSAHYSTSADIYPLVSRATYMRGAELNKEQGVGRYSMVTSGKAMHGEELDRACGYFAELHSEGGISLCASLGLLAKDDLQKIFNSGVHRYHCNLETAPSYFNELCTTHSIEDKLRTIRAAKELGFEICSGGIIGMGESRRQRIELALTLREISPVSIPLNILCPIPGTPLEKMEPLSEAEILATVAIFRMIHPTVVLRFAGGRMALSREAQLRAMEIGVNGAIMGDLLTTLGAKVREDKELVTDAGYVF